MASYKIEWKQSAKKELKNLDRTVIPKIVEAATTLAQDPYPPGSKKLVGTKHTYRIRVGTYRIVYSVLANVLTIEIIRVGHRRNIYRNLP